MLYKVILTFGSVVEILNCDHSNESYWAVLSRGAVYYAVQGGSNFWVCEWNPKVWTFKGSYGAVPSCGTVYYAVQDAKLYVRYEIEASFIVTGYDKLICLLWVKSPENRFHGKPMNIFRGCLWSPESVSFGVDNQNLPRHKFAMNLRVKRGL